MMTGKEEFDRTRADYLERTAEQKTPPPVNFEIEDKGLENPILLFHLQRQKMKMLVGNEQTQMRKQGQQTRHQG